MNPWLRIRLLEEMKEEDKVINLVIINLIHNVKLSELCLYLASQTAGAGPARLPFGAGTDLPHISAYTGDESVHIHFPPARPMYTKFTMKLTCLN